MGAPLMVSYLIFILYQNHFFASYSWNKHYFCEGNVTKRTKMRSNKFLSLRTTLIWKKKKLICPIEYYLRVSISVRSIMIFKKMNPWKNRQSLPVATIDSIYLYIVYGGNNVQRWQKRARHCILAKFICERPSKQYEPIRCRGRWP